MEDSFENTSVNLALPAMDDSLSSSEEIIPDSVKISKPVDKDRTRIHYRRFHNIYLYITEQCQLRCGHCYMGDRLERAMVMPEEQAKNIIKYGRKLGGEYITFLGGEPTLHPKLLDFVDYALDQGYRQVMINSNGLLEKNIYKLSPEKLHYISFSLDGATPNVHDRVRAKGTFKKTIKCISKAIAAGYAVRVISTISQINIHEAEAILDLADGLGVQMCNFHLFSEEGIGINNSGWSLTPEEWVAFYERLETIKDNYRTSIWYPPSYASKAKMDQYVSEGYRGCVGCSLDRLSIFPDGRCYVCSVLFDTPMHFANITENGLSVNKEQTNEFDLFCESAFKVDEPWMSGCPAEKILESNGKKATPEYLTPVCRLWKSQI